MDDLLAPIIEEHEVGGSSRRLVQSPRDAPGHAIHVLKDDAPGRVVDCLRIWCRIIELADEGLALREHDVCVGRSCPVHGRCVHISPFSPIRGGCGQNFRCTIPSSPGLRVPHERPSLLPIQEVALFLVAQMLNRTVVT